jgi:manganese/zinc/iron transport system substrate-binding protein
MDPAGSQHYQDRGQAYLAQLEELDAWTRAEMSAIPREQRVMVTSHDAFQYFGAAYEVEVHAVIGISTEQQPRPQDIEALEKLVRDRKVKALFIETSVSATLNQLVRKVAQATGAKVGGQLHSDSLGEPGTEAGTYIGMIRHNVKTLAEALR